MWPQVVGQRQTAPAMCELQELPVRKGENQMSMTIDLIGKRFGRIVALAPDKYVRGGGTYWFCVCDCGKQMRTQRSNLTNGGTTSCGCVFKDGRARPNRGRLPKDDRTKDLSVPSNVGTRKKLRLHDGPVGGNPQYQPFIRPESALWFQIGAGK